MVQAVELSKTSLAVSPLASWVYCGNPRYAGAAVYLQRLEGAPPKRTQWLFLEMAHDDHRQRRSSRLGVGRNI